MTPLLLSISEAAQALRLGRTVVYELIRTGRLRSLRVGARRLVPRDALDEFIARLHAEQDGEVSSLLNPR